MTLRGFKIAALMGCGVVSFGMAFQVANSDPLMFPVNLICELVFACVGITCFWVVAEKLDSR